MNTLTTVIAFASLIVLSACASPAPPPPTPDYVGQDVASLNFRTHGKRQKDIFAAKWIRVDLAEPGDPGLFRENSAKNRYAIAAGDYCIIIPIRYHGLESAQYVYHYIPVNISNGEDITLEYDDMSAQWRANNVVWPIIVRSNLRGELFSRIVEFSAVVGDPGIFKNTQKVTVILPTFDEKNRIQVDNINKCREIPLISDPRFRGQGRNRTPLFIEEATEGRDLSELIRW